MITKTFKIMSNSEEFLTPETVAQALLKQVTCVDEKPRIFFAVAECKEKGSYLECENFVTINNS